VVLEICTQTDTNPPIALLRTSTAAADSLQCRAQAKLPLRGMFASCPPDNGGRDGRSPPPREAENILVFQQCK